MEQQNTAQWPAALQAALTEYQSVRSKFEAARDAADRITADIQKHNAAADAAEAEAQQVREEAAKLMRSATTTPNDLRELKAKERAAYSMTEDYRAIVSEFKQAHEDATLSVGMSKREEGLEYSCLLTTYADTLMKEAAAFVAPLCRAIEVQKRAYESEVSPAGKAHWEHFHKSAADAALARMFDVIRAGFSTFEFNRASDAVLQAAQRPAGLSRFKTMSVATKHYRETLRRLAAERNAT
ncbi:hypothetical protein [Ralstonia pseudosolanacearum]